MRVFRLISALAFVLMAPVAAWAADFMYVSLGDNTIRRYDVSLGTAGAVAASEQIFVNTGQGLLNPWGLAFDSSGNLYAANADRGTITRYSSTGVYDGSPFVPTGQGLLNPYGLAFDSSGKLYVSNPYADTITRYSSTGVYDGSPFVSGQGLRGPIGLAFDSSGNLYAANFSGKTISKINSAGTVLFSWSTPESPRFLAFVPEPSTYILGTLAALTLAVLARKRHRTA